MSDKRRLYTDVYGLVSTDAKGFQVVTNLPRGTVVSIDARQRLVEDEAGRQFRLDKARLQQVVRASVPVDR